MAMPMKLVVALTFLIQALPAKTDVSSYDITIKLQNVKASQCCYGKNMTCRLYFKYSTGNLSFVSGPHELKLSGNEVAVNLEAFTVSAPLDGGDVSVRIEEQLQNGSTVKCCEVSGPDNQHPEKNVNNFQRKPANCTLNWTLQATCAQGFSGPNCDCNSLSADYFCDSLGSKHCRKGNNASRCGEELDRLIQKVGHYLFTVELFSPKRHPVKGATHLKFYVDGVMLKRRAVSLQRSKMDGFKIMSFRFQLDSEIVFDSSMWHVEFLKKTTVLCKSQLHPVGMVNGVPALHKFLTGCTNASFINVFILCQIDYFGRKCDQFCPKNDNKVCAESLGFVSSSYRRCWKMTNFDKYCTCVRDTGRFDCNYEGKKQCKAGWFGEECDMCVKYSTKDCQGETAPPCHSLKIRFMKAVVGRNNSKNCINFQK